VVWAGGGSLQSRGFTATSLVVALAPRSQTFCEVIVPGFNDRGGLSSNNSMQRTALRAAADAER